MSLPVTDKQELFVNGYGTESIPQGISVKGSLWTVMQSYGKLLIKEYYTDYVSSLRFSLLNFTVSPALQSNGTFYSDRFWVWCVNVNKVLILFEIEPNIGSDSIVHFTRVLYLNVGSVSVYLNEFDAVRVLVLSNSLPKSLKLLRYIDVKVDSPVVTVLDWDSTRLNSLTNFVSLGLSVAYSNAASPPSIYTEDYSVPIPVGLTAVQVSPLGIQVDWGVSLGSDQYVLQRSDDPLFGTSIDVYTGPLLTFLDMVPSVGVYYYRVKAQIISSLLESGWSNIAEVGMSLGCDISDGVSVSENLQVSKGVTPPPSTISISVSDFVIISDGIHVVKPSGSNCGIVATVIKQEIDVCGQLYEQVNFFDYNCTPPEVFHLVNKSGSAVFVGNDQSAAMSFTPGNPLVDYIQSHTFPAWVETYRLEGDFTCEDTWVLQVLNASSVVIQSWVMPASGASLHFARNFVNSPTDLAIGVKINSNMQLDFSSFAIRRMTYSV